MHGKTSNHCKYNIHTNNNMQFLHRQYQNYVDLLYGNHKPQIGIFEGAL